MLINMVINLYLQDSGNYSSWQHYGYTINRSRTLEENDNIKKHLLSVNIECSSRTANDAARLHVFQK